MTILTFTKKNMVSLIKEKYELNTKDAKELIKMDLEDFTYGTIGKLYGYCKNIKSINDYEDFLNWLENNGGE